MSSSERKIGPIDVRWGRDEYRYYVIGDSFYKEWKSGMDCSKHSWPLQGLSPDLVETVGRSPTTTRTVRLSMLLLASSVIVFFSDYNRSIPLLAPFLFGLSAWWLINALRTVTPRTWTEARKSNGEAGLYMVQPEQRTEEWSRFHQALSEAIREVNEAKT